MSVTPEEAHRIVGLYHPLREQFDATNRLTKSPPLLAHYTSVQVAEQIIKHEKLWFSHPFYMNDLEELRLGMLLGIQNFPTYVQAAVNTSARRDLLLNSFNHFIGHMNEETLVDTYVLCLSEHKPNDTDGVLSMWRSYASQGHGVALVFDGANIPDPAQAPMWISKVKYCTPDDRLKILHDSLSEWVRITGAANLRDDQLYLASYGAFLFIKAFALITKHIGFDEEKEWRIIYTPEMDPEKLLVDQFGYHISQRGAEPKLKFKIAPVQNISTDTTKNLSLARILHSVLLGPSISSPLAKAAFQRMLATTSLRGFEDRVYASTIPLRPTIG